MAQKKISCLNCQGVMRLQKCFLQVFEQWNVFSMETLQKKLKLDSVKNVFSPSKSNGEKQGDGSNPAINLVGGEERVHWKKVNFCPKVSFP